MTKKEILRLKAIDSRIKELSVEIADLSKNDKRYRYKVNLLNSYVENSRIDRIFYKLYKGVK
jgi:hypothetical protein